MRLLGTGYLVSDALLKLYEDASNGNVSLARASIHLLPGAFQSIFPRLLGEDKLTATMMFFSMLASSISC